MGFLGLSEMPDEIATEKFELSTQVFGKLRSTQHRSPHFDLSP
jgi:hypothetical protein